jgi:excisionase family DNA binding protein
MNNLLSLQEVASLLGISRIAVFNKVKKGEIPAVKVGKSYVVDKNNLTIIQEREPTDAQKTIIKKAIAQTVSDYSEALKLLKDN